MSAGVSEKYKKLSRAEAQILSRELDGAWKDPEIPMRQWSRISFREIEEYRSGKRFKHFDTLHEMLRRIPGFNRVPDLLDIGASTGLYREILRIGGFDCKYTAVDYSEAFERLGKQLFPDIRFRIGDARALPFENESFDIALSGCCLIHIFDYEKAIFEAARVSREYVIFNRTPIAMDGETLFFEKEAYGVRCLEIHFAQEELEPIFKSVGLSIVDQKDIFMDHENRYGHTSILLRKEK